MGSAIASPEITEFPILVVMFVHQVEVDIQINVVLHPTQGQLIRPLSI